VTEIPKVRANNLTGIIIVFVVLTLIMSGCFYFLWSKVNPPDPQIDSQHKIAINKGKVEEHRILFPLESFVVNLADDDEQMYLRMSMVIELTNEEVKQEVTSKLSLIKDCVLKVLPQKKSKEIISASGRLALSEEIMDKLNLLLKNGSVSNIFFTEYMIQ
jgi:flagellar protein FliL